MKKQQRRTALFFMFTALLVTVCRCQANPLTPDIQGILFTDNSLMKCEGLTEILDAKEGAPQQPDAAPGTTSRYVYECELPCPDGSTVKFDIYDQVPRTKEDKAAYQAQYCSAESMASVEETVEPSPTATATATVTPPAPEQQVIIIPPQNLLIHQPLLDGKFTSCDLAAGYINFTLAQPPLDISGKNVVLTMNGKQAECSVPNNNAGLYSCAFPFGQTFPAQIIVTVDGTEINKFSIDGAVCSASNPNEEGTDEAPTAPPTVPTVDCTIDPYNPAC